MSGSEISGGALLAHCLANEGVRLVAGLPAPELAPLLESLDANRMRFVPVRSGAAAAQLAEGLYRTSGQVAAVIGRPGSGSANLLPGVVGAQRGGIPVVVITSEQRRDSVMPAASAAFAGQDPLDLYRLAVKWSASVRERERIPELVHRVFQELTLGRPGPVLLELSQAALNELGNPRDESFASSIPQRPAQAEPVRARLEQAAQMLARAERPLVVAGGGVDRDGANAALFELVERLACPIVTTLGGRSAFPLDHPHALCGFSSGAQAALREADVVLVVGSPMGDLDPVLDEDTSDGARQSWIQIGASPRSLGGTRPLALDIAADARTGLGELLGLLRARRVHGADSNDLARYAAAARAWRAEQFAALDRASGPDIHPRRAILEIGRVFGPDTIYAVDGVHTALWAHWALPPTRARSYHRCVDRHGVLGSGIPVAIGAKLADPGREVVCVTSEDAAEQSFMEMQTAAREGLKVTTIVFAERASTSDAQHGRAKRDIAFDGESEVVRWDIIAEGLGCRGVCASALDQLEPALHSARLAPGPNVVCLVTDRAANLALPAGLLRRLRALDLAPRG
ncbi:MAG: thiamine pyrophosphate-binding protein [Myxococcota bacterium]